MTNNQPDRLAQIETLLAQTAELTRNSIGDFVLSGFDEETGIYELTATRADYLYSKSLPFRTAFSMSMEDYALFLRQKGFEVVSVHRNFLKVKATDTQLWKALTTRSLSG